MLMQVKHNLEKEEKLINLLGYNLVGPNNSNRWLILDKNQKQVGYIQYKKTYHENKKAGFMKAFGYHTKIDSPDITYEYTRAIVDKYGNILNNKNYNYSFDIKRNNQDSDHVELSIGENPSITIWSSKYGFIDFKTNYKGLYLNYKSQTDNFNIEEILAYKNIDDEYHDNKEYTYQIKYCKKPLTLSDYNNKGITTREISGIQNYNNENQLKICEKTWLHSKLRNKKEYIVEGNVEEMALKHQMGIDCFNHFKYLINQIIPFQEEVVSSLITKDIINQQNLSMFFSEEKKDNIKTKKLKINN